MPVEMQERLGHILSDGLAELPERTRRVLRLRYLERMDLRAIARALHIDEPLAGRLLAEGHRALRRETAPTLRVHGFL